MGRSVFAVAHGIVGEHENRRQLHQGGEPDRRSRVIAEDEEGRAESAKLGQRRARSRWPPWRARGCRSASSSRRDYRPGSRRRPRRSEWSCSTVQDPPNRQGTRGCSARARSAPWPKRLAPRCLWGRRERPADCGPIRPAVPVSASVRFRSRAPGTWRGKQQKVPSIVAGPSRRALRCRRRNARRRRRAQETLRLRASRRPRLVSRTSSSPSGSPWAAAVSCLCGAP